MIKVIRLGPEDKNWVEKIFSENISYLNSDFDKAWAEGVFYGIPLIGFIRIKLGVFNCICELAIDKEHRNKGYGSVLLEYAISPCLVATHIDNLPANKFYEKNGFLHQGEAPGSDGSALNIYRRG